MSFAVRWLARAAQIKDSVFDAVFVGAFVAESMPTGSQRAAMDTPERLYSPEDFSRTSDSWQDNFFDGDESNPGRLDVIEGGRSTGMR